MTDADEGRRRRREKRHLIQQQTAAKLAKKPKTNSLNPNPPSSLEPQDEAQDAEFHSADEQQQGTVQTEDYGESELIETEQRPIAISPELSSHFSATHSKDATHKAYQCHHCQKVITLKNKTNNRQLNFTQLKSHITNKHGYSIYAGCYIKIEPFIKNLNKIRSLLLKRKILSEETLKKLTYTISQYESNFGSPLEVENLVVLEVIQLFLMGTDVKISDNDELLHNIIIANITSS